MCRDVGVEVGGVAECLVTVGALVGRGGAVSGLVLLKMCLLSEFLVANSTLEWSLTYSMKYVFKQKLKFSTNIRKFFGPISRSLVN